MAKELERRAESPRVAALEPQWSEEEGGEVRQGEGQDWETLG